MTDNPVSPAHYQKKGGYETIDYLEAVCADVPGDEAVSVANIIKYVSRYRQKNPLNPTRDLKKAAWYLNNLIGLIEEKEGLENPPTPHDEYDYVQVPHDEPSPELRHLMNQPAPWDKPGAVIWTDHGTPIKTNTPRLRCSDPLCSTCNKYDDPRREHYS